MQRSVWHIAAALTGASGVGAAAYGAHALPKLIAANDQAAAARSSQPPTPAAAPSSPSPAPEERASPELREACFRRANHMQLTHALLMAVAPLARRPAVVGGLALAGTLSFCSPVYAVALTGERSRGIMAPAGGFCFMAAWLALAL